MFSICIPNYNYEKYLGATLDSVLNQSLNEFEIVVADNCSTDSSIEILNKYKSTVFDRLKYKVNPCNLGFAGNLDQAVSLSSYPYVIMLSSDDLIKQDALLNYQAIVTSLSGSKKVIVCSAIEIVDSNGVVIGEHRARNFRFEMWSKNDIDPVLSSTLKSDVYRVKSNILLKRALLHCANPFNFCATCYSKDLYDLVGGYGGGRLINPDKWFHWKIMAGADEVIFIDKPLFQYRWHNSNQTAQQRNSGYLKFLLDEYRNSIEISDGMLLQAGISRDTFNKAFIHHDIYRHGFGEFLKGRWLKSLRIYFFGVSTYPGLMLRNLLFPLYTIILLSTPLGAFMMSIFRKKVNSWRIN